MIHESQVKTFVKKISSHFLLDSDPCSDFCFPTSLKKAHIQVSTEKEEFICGLNFIQTLVTQLYPTSSFKLLHRDNRIAKAGTVLFSSEIDVHNIIQFKTLALYLLSRMSSVASLAKSYKELLSHTTTKLSEPRFFTPHMELIEREALEQVGVHTHKRFFKKTIAIKQEHIALHKSITELFNTLTESLPPTTRIEIHVKNLGELQEASRLGADLIVLENFDKNSIRLAERINQKRSYLELSGAIGLEEVKDFSLLGLDFLSSELIIASSSFVHLDFKVLG